MKPDPHDSILLREFRLDGGELVEVVLYKDRDYNVAILHNGDLVQNNPSAECSQAMILFARLTQQHLGRAHA